MTERQTWRDQTHIAIRRVKRRAIQFCTTAREPDTRISQQGWKSARCLLTGKEGSCYTTSKTDQSGLQNRSVSTTLRF